MSLLSMKQLRWCTYGTILNISSFYVLQLNDEYLQHFVSLVLDMLEMVRIHTKRECLFIKDINHTCDTCVPMNDRLKRAIVLRSGAERHGLHDDLNIVFFHFKTESINYLTFVSR